MYNPNDYNPSALVQSKQVNFPRSVKIAHGFVGRDKKSRKVIMFNAGGVVYVVSEASQLYRDKVTARPKKDGSPRRAPAYILSMQSAKRRGRGASQQPQSGSGSVFLMDDMLI